MLRLLSTSHAQITDNDHLANKPYFCLSLLGNLSDLLRLFDTRSIILGVFGLVLHSEDPFYPLIDGISLGALDFFLAKPNFLDFGVFLTPLET